MAAIAAALLVCGAVGWAAYLIASALGAAKSDRRRDRELTLLTTFAPIIAASQQDPQTLVVWQPIARAARTLFPDEFARLDAATGATFPFSADRVASAHAQWTADWLAWERMHDAEYKRRAVEAEHELAAAGGAILRTRLDAIEREKLELYQRRYEQYIKVAKALQSLNA